MSGSESIESEKLSVRCSTCKSLYGLVELGSLCCGCFCKANSDALVRVQEGDLKDQKHEYMYREDFIQWAGERIYKHVIEYWEYEDIDPEFATYMQKESPGYYAEYAAQMKPEDFVDANIVYFWVAYKTGK